MTYSITTFYHETTGKPIYFVDSRNEFGLLVDSHPFDHLGDARTFLRTLEQRQLMEVK